ncbi:DNA-directed RNA polymerase III subunit RPC6 [Skeletonema marinoi]|uniref:DNA-directed RNA polymerase III subunit RPC6 n=1 Tax=Skeletonema marinoi TaxID=267567 RepID=A0AAD9DCZ8_9STRA|nr:DNA-directed RNA polymerase III subunit RPC6 [Skeletonema marinoi]
MPPKRPPSIAIATAATKRRRGTAIKPIVSMAVSTSVGTSYQDDDGEDSNPLRKEFLQLLSAPQYKGRGVANSALKAHFGDKYTQLVPIINELTRASRLTMSKANGENEVYFSLLSAVEASKMQGLDAHSKLVYQVIESAGNKGIWTVDIRVQTNIPQATLTKIFKQLETRKLIKPIKAVTAKTKKLYMLYDLVPAKEITGGPWYTEGEFDHEFIAELRNFIIMCVRRMNRGKGVSIQQISDKMVQANVSRVQLSLEEVRQLVQTLLHDYVIEERGVTDDGMALFVPAKKITTMCEFGWWDVCVRTFILGGLDLRMMWC